MPNQDRIDQAVDKVMRLVRCSGRQRQQASTHVQVDSVAADKGEKGKVRAEWILDYDYVSDECYKRPGCPKCNAPITLSPDGKCYCVSCGKLTKADEGMMKWLRERAERKVESMKCLVCGSNECETHMVRNNVTMKWQVAWGECRKCGARFIV
ncbi:MAG: hypothetical protein IKE04_05570 [Oscillospiraceae bacterium]|nr:hypothetical protein [Oscillospiraceae bacterium]